MNSIFARLIPFHTNFLFDVRRSNLDQLKIKKGFFYFLYFIFSYYLIQPLIQRTLTNAELVEKLEICPPAEFGGKFDFDKMYREMVSFFTKHFFPKYKYRVCLQILININKYLIIIGPYYYYKQKRYGRKQGAVATLSDPSVR